MGGVVSSLFGGGGGGGIDMPPPKQAATTAGKVEGQETLTPAEKKNRRLMASLMTKDWGQPALGKAGLMGI